ncbi:hypothetical protein D9613_004538 [Agrocybe pediades]|uniref:F-box domain-containing protein n=1 Tax=Agrocybe pediades TaxID=84607 RepID=A0A8H4VKR1_9AGAR|nr:hypothetical protein D9613_004538 [Agrocybe pediades]
MEKFPPEIASYIFKFAVEAESECTAARSRLAVQLSSVCKSWRKVALMTPHLWTHIYISTRKEYSEEWLSILEEWISRSKCLLIDVVFVPFLNEEVEAQVQAGLSVDTTVEELKLVAALTKSIGKWRSFVSCRNREPHDLFHTILVKTNGQKFLSLTELEVRSMTPADCIDAIERSPLLRSFSALEMMPLPNPEYQAVVHKSLEVLNLASGWWGSHSVETVLSRFIFPKLHETFLDLADEFIQKPVVEFFERHRHDGPSPSKLMKLHLNFGEDIKTGTVFKQIAGFLPNLTELTLDYQFPAELNEGELVYLWLSGSPEKNPAPYVPPLPKLQSLEYYIGTRLPRRKTPFRLWPFILALFPIALKGGDPPSLRPELKTFITNCTFSYKEKLSESITALRDAGIVYEEVDRSPASDKTSAEGDSESNDEGVEETDSDSELDASDN